MPARGPLGLSSIVLGCLVATTALLGPWGFGVIRYRTSPTTLNQIVGGDAAAMVVVAPLAVVAGILLLRGHRAGPVLALAPSVFVVYTYAQLIVGEEYLRLPGNNERYFPLLLSGFILAGGIAVAADLGILAPVAAVTSVGLWHRSARALATAYAVVGGFTLLAASVTGMALTMYRRGDPDASLPTVVAFTVFTLMFAGLATALYRPLFAQRREIVHSGG